MKKAFTLAEVMIVLVVLGVLAGILVPIGIQSTPDKNVMKFKKADTALKNVIRTLVNSDKYCKNGDLGMRADGKIMTSARADEWFEKSVQRGNDDN